MVIDLKKLKIQGKTEIDFFFEYEDFGELCSLPETEVLKPIKVLGKLEVVSNNSVIVSGEINFVLSGPCSRCLEETVKEYSVSFDEDFSKDDETSYLIQNDKVDLSKMVDDLVILNMPYNLLCKEDCKGICLNCGKNLNKENCNC